MRLTVQTKNLDMSIDEGWELSQSGYNDAGEIADYALTPMNWCFSRHIMFIHSPNGYEYSICPRVAPTRADTATMFWNFSYVLNND